MHAEHGHVLLKTGKELQVYRVDKISFANTFEEVVETVHLESEDSEITLVDVTDYHSKLTDENIRQVSCSIDTSSKEKQLEMLLRPADAIQCKLLIKESDSIKCIEIRNSDVKEVVEEVKGEPFIPESNRDSLDSKHESLIDRKLLRNIEDFDVYESLIQGESLYKQPFLIDTHKILESNELVFDISFDKPISLFCLGMELYFDAKVDDLKKYVSTKPISIPKVDPKEPIDTLAGAQNQNVSNLGNTKIDANDQYMFIEKNYDNVKSDSVNMELENENKCIPLVVYTHEG